MAHLELSAEEARKLVEALRMVEIPWMDSGRDHDPLLAIRERADNLSFNIRACIVCGTEFEATNPRKQTCSDACRQVLSRSNRPAPLFKKGDVVITRKRQEVDAYSFTVTKVNWSAGEWFYKGADGLGNIERRLRLVPAKKSRSKRDSKPSTAAGHKPTVTEPDTEPA